MVATDDHADPLADLTVTLRQAGERETIHRRRGGSSSRWADASARCRARPSCPTRCEAQHDPADPTAPTQPSALPRDCTHFSAETTAHRRVVLRRPMVTEVLIDGYTEAAKVMRWGGMRPRVDGTVATTRGALRLALWHGRGRMLCVAGHTDALGQDPDNDALSLERARSVQLYASGDLDGWAEHCAVHASELDHACALVACNRIVGRAAITLEQPDAIELARRHLRMRAGLGEHATPADEWRAVAGLYDVDLAAFLRTDLAGLAEIRGTLAWVEPPARGLGERYPRPQAETADATGSPALAQRRCALLVFGRDDGAHVAAARELCEVYDGTYRRTVLPVPGEVLVQIAVGNGRRDPVARARAWIGVGTLGVAEHHADIDGTVRFMTFAGDRIRVAAAFDASGRGTITAAGLDTAANATRSSAPA
jgi:hypothetical protein